MKNKFLFTLLIFTLLIPTQAIYAGGEEPKPGDVLCPPGAYLTGTENCLPLGAIANAHQPGPARHLPAADAPHRCKT